MLFQLHRQTRVGQGTKDLDIVLEDSRRALVAHVEHKSEDEARYGLRLRLLNLFELLKRNVEPLG